ncbi:phage capsid protein [Gemmiger sp. An87]|nr:phage capsid protein [Gemmiger sp. An87]
MANEVNIYTPRYLAEVVRQAPVVHTFFRDTFFSNVKISPAKSVDIDIKKGGREMAAFVHPRVGGTAMRGKGYQTKSYTPPLINPYIPSTADNLMNRMPGEDLYSGRTPAQRAAEQLMEEYNTLNDATTRREEWMAVQAIVTGQIPIVGQGVNEVIDFGFTNKKKLEGTARWGQSAANPLKDLDDWVDDVLTNGFTNVDMVIMGKTALDLFLSDTKVQKMLDIRRIEMGLVHPRDLPNGVRYIGHLNKPNVDIYEYKEVYLDDWTDPDEPETKPLIPNNAVVLISSTANYMMAYGLCTYIDDASQQWVSAETSRLLRSYVEHHPDRRMVELQAHPLPIPDKADSWLVATVCD